MYGDCDFNFVVFPAYAGMIPNQEMEDKMHKGVPRIRGDDPCEAFSNRDGSVCSPHTRG